MTKTKMLPLSIQEQMRDLLKEATSAWADQFDGPEDEDLSVSGADLVDWFAQWRLKAKDLLDRISAEANP